MRRLLVFVNNSNVSTYVDTFINHGKLFAFPWLIAHHLTFFGNLDKLSILDTLLTFRRGYNPGIGSKIRKLYFSDVNRILKHFHEFPITCCEKFDETIAFTKTVDLSDCLTILHKISEYESFDTTIDDFDQDIDIHEEVKNPVRIEEVVNRVIKEDKEITTNLGLFLKKLADFSSKNIEDVLTLEQIKGVKELKEKRRIELEKIKDEKNTLFEELRSVPKEQSIVFGGKLVKGKDKRLNYYKLIVKSIINMFEKHDLVIQPIEELAEIYENTKGPFFTTEIENIKKLVKEHLDLKKEHKYRTPEEIQHLCKTLHLEERVDYLNECHDELEQKIEIYKKEKSYIVKKECKELNDLVNSLTQEVSPMIEVYNSIDENRFNLKFQCRPVNLKSLINYALDTNKARTKFWDSMTINGRISIEDIVDNLKKLHDKIERDIEGIKADEKNELKNKLDFAYEEGKKYILSSLNKNEMPDISKIDEDYNNILNLRKEILKRNENLYFTLEDLCLNRFEMTKVLESIDYMVKNETRLDNSKRYLRDKVTSILDVKQNRRIFEERHGISRELNPEEWKKEVFRVSKPMFERDIEEMSQHIKTFEETVGISPYGIIIGYRIGNESFNIENESAKIDCFGFKKQESYYEDIIQINKESIIEERSFEDMDCSYLTALIKGKTPDYNARSKKLKEEIRNKLNVVNNKKVEVSKETREERIYDILNENNNSMADLHMVRNPGMKIKKSSGKKIESDFNYKKLKRSAAERKFRDIVVQSAVKSVNIYEELQIEEAICDSNEIVNIAFQSDVMPYSCFDFKKQRKYRIKKVDKINTERMNGKKGIDIMREHNKFDIENNSNANKNYSVHGMISYIKILVSFKLLNLNVNKEIYKSFGLKKCQSTYLKMSLVKLVQRMLDSNKLNSNISLDKS